MLKIKTMSLLLISIVISGCISTHKARVGFDVNSTIETKNYKTFAWLKNSKVLTESIDANPVIKVRIENVIEQAFINKGYSLKSTPEEADFTISYTMGSRDKVKVNNLPVSYRTGFGWGHRYFGGISMNHESHVNNYTEGKLAIDVYDVKSHQPVWHGWAVKRVTNKDKDNPSRVIQSVVEQVVTQF